MLLGDVIERLDDEVVALETLLALNDLGLLRRVQDAAAADASTPGGFIAQSVARFSSDASDEDWVSLIGAMGRTEDPGVACVRAMLEFALRPSTRPRGCGHGA